MKFLRLIVFLPFIASTQAESADINILSSLDFGAVTASFYGDVIQIDASENQSAPFVLSGGKSVVSGGQSALAVFTPDSEGQIVNISYPVNIEIISGAEKMTVRDISLNSTKNFVTQSTSPVNINIGGVLEIGASQKSGNYSGTALINITINNP